MTNPDASARTTLRRVYEHVFEVYSMAKLLTEMATSFLGQTTPSVLYCYEHLEQVHFHTIHSIIPKQAGWRQHRALTWGCCGRQLNSHTKNYELHSTTYSVILFWWQHRWSSFLESLDLELDEVIHDAVCWEAAGIPGGLLVKRRPLGTRLALQGVHTTLNYPLQRSGVAWCTQQTKISLLGRTSFLKNTCGLQAEHLHLTVTWLENFLALFYSHIQITVFLWEQQKAWLSTHTLLVISDPASLCSTVSFYSKSNFLPLVSSSSTCEETSRGTKRSVTQMSIPTSAAVAGTLSSQDIDTESVSKANITFFWNVGK